MAADPKIVAAYKTRLTRQLVISFGGMAIALSCIALAGDSTVLIGAGVLAVAATLVFSFVNWRCPKCASYLGRSIWQRHCPKCGVQFKR